MICAFRKHADSEEEKKGDYESTCIFLDGKSAKVIDNEEERLLRLKGYKVK